MPLKPFQESKMMNDILSDFGENLNIAVIGASGGIGRAFVDVFSKHHNVESVYAFSRSGTSFNHAKISNHTIDIQNEESIRYAVDHMGDIEFDIVIAATGLLHSGDGLAPEKNLNDLSIKNFQDIFAVNTFGPALIAKYFTPFLPRDRKSVFAALSARVGSISDNHLGGWYAYRASKTALNMIIKNISIEIARQNKNACIVCLHPGTTDTALSKPFQNNVPTEKLFTPQYSVEKMIDVLERITPEQTGQILAYDGSIIQ